MLPFVLVHVVFFVQPFYDMIINKYECIKI